MGQGTVHSDSIVCVGADVCVIYVELQNICKYHMPAQATVCLQQTNVVCLIVCLFV